MFCLRIKKNSRILPDCYHCFLSCMIPGGNASWHNYMVLFLQGVTNFCSVQLWKFMPYYQKRQKSYHSRLPLWAELNHLMLKWVARTPNMQNFKSSLVPLLLPLQRRIFLQGFFSADSWPPENRTIIQIEFCPIVCWIHVDEYSLVVRGDANRKHVGVFPVLWLQHRRYKQKIRWCVGAMTQYTPFSHMRIICNLTQKTSQPPPTCCFLIQTTTKIIIPGK